MRRVAIKPCGNGAHELFRVGNAHHCGDFGCIDGFADHKCGSAVFNGLVHKRVAVGLRAFHGHKQKTGADAARIDGNASDVSFEISDGIDNFRSIKEDPLRA